MSSMVRKLKDLPRDSEGRLIPGGGGRWSWGGRVNRVDDSGSAGAAARSLYSSQVLHGDNLRYKEMTLKAKLDAELDAIVAARD